jgi:hypothetical protein
MEMSKKHEQRTRAEILAKRNQPIQEVRVIRTIQSPKGPIDVPQSTSSEKLRAAFNASKYMPHFGNKQRAKLMAKAAQPEAFKGWLSVTA